MPNGKHNLPEVDTWNDEGGNLGLVPCKKCPDMYNPEELFSGLCINCALAEEDKRRAQKTDKRGAQIVEGAYTCCGCQKEFPEKEMNDDRIFCWSCENKKQEIGNLIEPDLSKTYHIKGQCYVCRTNLDIYANSKVIYCPCCSADDSIQLEVSQQIDQTGHGYERLSNNKNKAPRKKPQLGTPSDLASESDS